MGINKHNYEAFFLDYIEGNLATEEIAELLLFLEKNPSIKDELEEFELVDLSDDSNIYSNKEELKQHINENNVEEYIIGSIEGVNSAEDEKDLSVYVNHNPEKIALFDRYKKTILVAPEVVFTNKNTLKKRNRLVVLYPLIGVAASLLIFFMLSENNPTQKYKPQGISLIDTTPTNESEESNYIVIKESSVQKKNTIGTHKNILPIKKDSVIKEFDFVQPQNDIALAPNDTLEMDTLSFDTPELENLIVIEDSVSINNSNKEEPFTEPSNNELTINEWANKQVRNKVFNQKSKNTDKIEKDEVFWAIANGLNKLSKQDIAYNNESSTSYTTKGFSIGGFEVSRTKRKKIKS